MYKYLITKYYALIDNIRISRAKTLAKSYSNVMNGQKIAVFPNVGLGIIVQSRKTLLIADRRYVYMNRSGFLLARRRGMFDKDLSWTDALQSTIYVS